MPWDDDNRGEPFARRNPVLEALHRANEATGIAMETGDPIDEAIARFAAGGIERAAWWEETKAKLRVRGIDVQEDLDHG
jgi:hypothetical protein